MKEAKFKAGDIVYRSNEPEVTGAVVSPDWNQQAECWYYVVAFGTRRRKVPEDVLRTVDLSTSPWQLVENGSFAGRRSFVSTLTYHRLRRPPSRIAYSFATARTQFFPHQFKPLLKFLDHPSKRILIADDVGLGKTIEAGYILRELRARSAVSRVLILVPARLTTKWKRELESRFDEHFEIVKRQQLLDLASRLERGKEPEPLRWITSYESARDDEVREAFDRIDPGIELLIADEAHRMRNADSLQHRMGAVLCRLADMVLFLSATPVHNSLDDLGNLLKLLSPEEFGDRASFADQMEANRPLLQAQRALNASVPQWNAAAEALDEFFQTRTGKHVAKGLLRADIEERLRRRSVARRELVALQADVARLSPTSHIISRTRKVEAMLQRAQRCAHWVPVVLSASERNIYDGVETICQLVAGGSWANEMAVVMAYRMTASCIPAAMQYFHEQFAGTPAEPVDEVFEESAEESEVDLAKQSTPLASWDPSVRGDFHQVVHGYRSGKYPDSKLERFVEALRDMWSADERARIEPRKVVVFSFFRRTLEYLARALTERRITNRMMHGRVPVLDRDLIVEEFLERSDVRVLLTSDVGGEGIDLQRASVLVNYDLPWNPMVVEQRIGRIDRIGQLASQIVIMNLVVEGSIEERILERLLKKIGIFEESIGEIDPIIGERIEKLTAQAVSGKLSADQLELQVAQEGDALERRVQEARTMLSRVDGLLAADQSLVDEIESVIGERQIPSETELLNFINRFLESQFVGLQLPNDLVTKVVQVDLRGKLPQAIEEWAHRSGQPATNFSRRAAVGLVPLTLSREAALRHTGAELLHLNHAIVRYSIDELQRAADRLDPAFCLRLEHSEVLPVGVYVFMMTLLEIGGNRPRTRFAAALADTRTEQVWADQDAAANLMIELLERSIDTPPVILPAEAIERIREKLSAAMDVAVNELGAQETRDDRVRVEHRHAALKAIADLRLERAREHVVNLTQKGVGGFALRMGEAKLQKRTDEQSGVPTAPALPGTVPIELEEIAVGVLVVGAAGHVDA